MTNKNDIKYKKKFFQIFNNNMSSKSMDVVCKMVGFVILKEFGFSYIPLNPL